jgi:2-dehydro-3-deoxyphosphogluconate aldolase/(4S)-4-hydroxy-2-oxoglutarate aldolase
MTDPTFLRTGPIANAIRRERLVAVLRRIEPREALLALVDELRDAGARIFEITMDTPDAANDLRAVRVHAGEGTVVGAGTVLSGAQLAAAREAGAAFAVSPLLDRGLVAESVDGGLPFIPGAMTPTEVRAAWDAGATFVKLFPASAVGPSFVRELLAPMPDVELLPTGGIDESNARAFLDAGAAAIGIGGAIVRADAAARRRLIAAVAGDAVPR